MTIPPPIHPITDIRIPQYESYKTIEGIPVYQIAQPACDLLRLELSFKAGRPFEKGKMISALCAGMMNESNSDFTADQIAGKVDYFGANLTCYSTMDTIEIELVCMRKFFGEMVDVAKSILNSPNFDKTELQNQVNRRKEKLKYQLAKNDVQAFRAVTEAMFGTEHPYGYNSEVDLLEKVTPEHLQEHYKRTITTGQCTIFLSGDILPGDKDIIASLTSVIRQSDLINIEPNDFPVNPTSNRYLHIKGSDQQTSIRLGRYGMQRNHPEFGGLNFLSMILGGFFGSRLVSNIREDKGLTYGIYSQLDCYRYNGTFMISTDVANENVDECVNEIWREMEVLQNEPIKDNEIELARNYAMGSYLNLFDGSFNSIRAIKSLALAQIPMSELKSSIDITMSIDSDQLMLLAQRYFNRNDFWNVVVGAV